MFHHVMVGSNDLERSRRFYDALFAVLGAGPGQDIVAGGIIYPHAGSRFVVTKPINGEPATVANGGTIAFSLDGAEQVDAWHAGPGGARPRGK